MYRSEFTVIYVISEIKPTQVCEAECSLLQIESIGKVYFFGPIQMNDFPFNRHFSGTA